MPLFLLLVAIPIIEIALFIQVGGWIGLWWTIAIVVLTAALGTVLLRAQGMAALAEVQGALQHGTNPAPAIAHGALILVAAVLLLTPGFFTDSVGLLLLVPPVRALCIRFLARRMTVVHRQGGRGGVRSGPAGAGTVEGEYEVVDPEVQSDHRPDSGTGSGWTRTPGRLPEG
jgi:UPF0716 protein FxsA